MNGYHEISGCTSTNDDQLKNDQPEETMRERN